MVDPIQVPEFKLKDGKLESRLLLIIYNYKLRVAIAKFRKKWGIMPDPAHPTEPPQSLLNRKAMRESFDDCNKILKLFKPTLSEAYIPLIYFYAIFDTIMPNSAIPPSIRQKGSKIIGRVDGRLGYQAAPYNMELKQTGDEKVIQITITHQLKPHEVTQLAEVITELNNQLPTMPAYGGYVKLLSQIADMRRRGLSNQEVAGKLKMNEGSIRVMYSRAKQNGL